MLEETAQIRKEPPSTTEGIVGVERLGVPEVASVPELTIVPLVTGLVLGLVFGATSLYLVLKVGLTISPSIPIAVISATLFRALTVLGIRNRSILENNITQTAGAAGESIAFGIGVTAPALLILGFDLKLINIVLVACIGGLLGILVMIPFRRRFIVQGHGHLPYPEGTTCAEVLQAGAEEPSQPFWDRGREALVSRGSAAQLSARFNSTPLFLGFGISVLFQTLMSVLKLWKEFPEKVFGAPLQEASISLENNPTLLGVGYIIGPRIAFTMAAGGAFSALVFIPFIKFFGQGSITSGALSSIAEMSNTSIRSEYIIYVGAGAILGAGLINLLRFLPTIPGNLINIFRKPGRHIAERDSRVELRRTDRDLPVWILVAGITSLTVLSIVATHLYLSFFRAVLMLMLVVVFVAISARVTGELGSTLLPISGMTVTALLIVCLVFLFVGWTQPPYYVAALSIGAIVCIAASTGGTASQVLKTGYLVGATPRNQQIAILLGALISALVLGHVLLKLNEAGTVLIPRVVFEKVEGAKMLSAEAIVASPPYTEKAKPPVASLYRLLHIEPNTPLKTDLDTGYYLVDELSGRIIYRIHYNFSLPQVDVSTLSETEEVRDPLGSEVRTYHVLLSPGDASEQPGKYLVDADGEVSYLVDPGINGAYSTTPDGRPVEKYAAPKATLMAYVIKGILSRQFPWALVLLGIMLAVTMELAGVSSLPFAVGVYLPFSSSTPIFIGGFIHWLVMKRSRKQSEDAADNETGRGMLLSAGFIVGGAMTGIVVALISGFLTSFSSSMERWSESNPLVMGPYSDLFSFFIFMMLALLLYVAARRRTPFSNRKKDGG